MEKNMREIDPKLLLLITAILVTVGIGILRIREPEVPPLQLSTTTMEIRVNQSVIGVSADHPLAVQVGMDILKKGGNAVDAAIAVSYMLAVVEPFASGLGGGGIMLVVPADASKAVVYDYLSTCPHGFSSNSTISCVPGFVAGLDSARQNFGTMSMDQLMEPAIQTANNGFPINASLSKRLSYAQYSLNGAGVEVFFPRGQALGEGEVLQQTLLAETLQRVARDGPTGFYQGSLAQSMVDAGTGIDGASLATYQVVTRNPVQAEFEGYTIMAPPPPTAGVTVLQSLMLAGKNGVKHFPYGSVDFITQFALINNIVYTDRLKYIADPAFQAVDSAWLLSGAHIDELSQSNADSVSVDMLLKDNPENKDRTNTTHFVIIDQYGNMASVTNSINTAFGCGRYVSGFFLNDGFANFNANTESINYPVAGKRARTYICPLIVTSQGRPVMALGTPGGVSIPQTLQEILYLNLIYGVELQAAIDKPRFYTEDNNTIYTEGDFKQEVVRAIQERQQLSIIAYSNHLFFGSVNALRVESGKAEVGCDQRREAAADMEIASN